MRCFRHIAFFTLLMGILSAPGWSSAMFSGLPQQESDSLKAVLAYRQAFHLMDSGQIDKARNEAEKVLFIGEDAHNPELLAATYTLLARIAEAQKNSTDYLYYLLRALSACEKLSMNEKAAGLSELAGDYYYRKNVFSKALEYYQRALALRSSLPPGRPAFILREKIGSCYLRSNQTTEAKNVMLSLLNDYRNTADSISVLRVLAQLSSLAVSEKKFLGGRQLRPADVVPLFSSARLFGHGCCIKQYGLQLRSASKIQRGGRPFPAIPATGIHIPETGRAGHSYQPGCLLPECAQLSNSHCPAEPGDGNA